MTLLRRPLPSKLYAIVDADAASVAGWNVVDLASAYLQAGVRLLQLRAKSSSGRDMLVWTEAIAAQAGDAWFVVNDRVDVALVADVPRVHLGQQDLPVAAARWLLGAGGVIGVSTHALSQATVAIADTAVDYVAVGPVYGTTTKATGYEPVGESLVREVRAVVASHGCPVVAIGGITLEQSPAVIEAGADAVAVITDLLIDHPERRARAYLRALGET